MGVEGGSEGRAGGEVHRQQTPNPRYIPTSISALICGKKKEQAQPMKHITQVFWPSHWRIAVGLSLAALACSLPQSGLMQKLNNSGPSQGTKNGRQAQCLV